MRNQQPPIIVCAVLLLDASVYPERPAQSNVSALRPRYLWPTAWVTVWPPMWSGMECLLLN